MTLDYSYSRATTKDFLDDFEQSKKELYHISIHHCPHICASEVMREVTKNNIHLATFDADTNFSLFTDVDAACDMMEAGCCGYLKIGSSGGLVRYSLHGLLQKSYQHLNRLLKCAAGSSCCVEPDRILPNEHRYNCAFKPKNEEEEQTKQRFVDLIKNHRKAFCRKIR